jgi:hypothetical protein
MPPLLTHIRIARWSALLLLAVVGLLLLNDALFSGWMAGGLPNEHKLGWERRSLASLLMAAASFLAAGAAFRVIPRIPRIGKLSWALVLAAVALAGSPFVAREVLIDSCRDSGGSWSRDFLECVR